MERDLLSQRIAEMVSADFDRNFTRTDALRLVLGCIDLTTLEGSNTQHDIELLCNRATGFAQQSMPTPAAVCVYPVFVSTAKQLLANTDIKVASVAAGFPAGQLPISLKRAEVEYAVEQGADEIDIVISRGKLLEGRDAEVGQEVATLKQAAKTARLKVILETGELKTPELIEKASKIAIASGADFIKTSTGKIAANATLEAFLVMLDCIKEHYAATKQRIGIKPAGGISSAADALNYVKVLRAVLGEPWMNKTYFRIGASRLANDVAMQLSNNR